VAAGRVSCREQEAPSSELAPLTCAWIQAQEPAFGGRREAEFVFEPYLPTRSRVYRGVMAGAAEIILGAGPLCAAAARTTVEAEELARRATFARLVRREASVALGVARRLLGDAGEAEDLVQEAFLRAWRHLERQAPDLDLRPWFYRILINAGRDRLRRRGVRRRDPVGRASDLSERPSPDPASTAAGRDFLDRVQAVVESLPLRQRECLLLRTRAHLSYGEMAVLLEITQGVVKGHLVQARRTLLRRFGGELKDWGLTR
jgi:RNA polymerase sigma-70 factor (ECF subfamily)